VRRPTGDRLLQRVERLHALVAGELLALSSAISSSTSLAVEFRLLDLARLLAACNRVYTDNTFRLRGAAKSVAPSCALQL
jgi:hypothetical protein